MGIKELFHYETSHLTALSVGQVVPDRGLCVQCGICTFNCPAGIDVRKYVWEEIPVADSHCYTCGECIQRCPRGVLRFEHSNISTFRF